MTHRALWLALLTCALSTPTALAHALGAECKAKGDKVEVEAFYSDDTPAQDATVSVVNADKKTVAEGRTDGKGRWSFPRPLAGAYQVVIDAGAGHRKEIKIAIADQVIPVEPPPEACCCCEAESSAKNVMVSDSPSRADFTRFPWLKAVMGCSILGMVGFGFWISRLRGRTEPGAALPEEGTP